MEVTTTTYRNILLFLGASVIVFVFSLVFLISSYATDRPVVFEDQLAINSVAADKKVRANKLRYYNGNNFIEVALDDASKKPLTSFDIIENVTSIHWLENGAVFSFSENPRASKLSKKISTAIEQLTSKGIAVDETAISNMYWYIDFTNDSLKLLTYTTNPFGVTVDQNTDTAYFTEPPTDEGFTYYGSIDDKGVIKNTIFGTPATTPSRIIGQKDDELYIVSADDTTIALSTFNTTSFKKKEVINDIYKDETADHTVYQEYFMHDNQLFFRTGSEAGNTIESIDIDSGDRKTVIETPESSTIEYIGGGEVRVTDTGDAVNKIRSLGLDGKEIRKPITINTQEGPSALVFTGDDIILSARPYIYLKSKNTDLKPITVPNLEKDFTSDYSSLDRDIFSETGDVNNYFLMVVDKPLSEEYKKVINLLKEKNIQKEDVTILPQLGAGATYDLN